MSVAAKAISRPVATSLLMLGAVLAGLSALVLLPKATVPSIDFPVISISATMPGGSPETMAASVATPLERRLGQIAGVTEMTSSSSLGSTRISLQFDLDRNIDGAQRDIQAAIAAARADLPAALRNNPTFRTSNPSEVPVAIIALFSQRLSSGQLFEIAANVLQQKFAQLEGVGQVSVGGSALPAVRVELDAPSLFEHGVSLEDVRAALAAANFNGPKGAIDEGDRRLTLYANDQSRRAADYQGLVVAYRNGAAVKLRDVAEIVDSVEDLRNYGMSNGRTAVQVQIFRQPGANFIDVVDRVKALMTPLGAALPADVEMRLVQDRTLTIRSSLNEIGLTLLITILLAVFIVYLSLKSVRATIAPSVCVPVSLIGAVGAMYLLGYSLNNLSLMALTIATGFIVDDAIVVVENVIRRVESGEPPRSAALNGANEVAPTIVSMSLSLLAVFLPILFMGGIVGRLMREFAMTLSVAILVSLVLSLTATPMLCSCVLREQSGPPSFFLARWSERGFAALQRAYVRKLDIALRRPRVTLGVLLAAIALNFYLFDLVPKGFFPIQDSGRMRGAIVADQSVSFPVMKEKLEQFVAIIEADSDVASATGTIGGGFGPGGAINVADLLVTLKPLGERKATANEIMARLRPKFARVSGANLFLQSVQDIRMGGRTSNALFQYTLLCDDLDALRRYAPRIVEELRRGGALLDVSSDQQDKGLRREVVIDRAKAARLDVTTSAIDNTLYDAFGQRQVSTIYEPLNQYHVVMEAAPRFRETLESLDELYIGGRVGAATRAFSPRDPTSLSNAINVVASPMVPFSSFARFGDDVTPLQVNHHGHFAAITISFNLGEGKSLRDAEDAIRDAMTKVGAPATLQGVFAGTATGYRDALANQPLMIAAALAAVYIVLGVLYESFLHPLTIISTLPSAGVGAFLALLGCGAELSIIAMIGVLLLIGIVKKNAIILVDFALDAERRLGMSSDEAIRAACVTRFRPILITTLVALFGALPLALGSGEGAEMRRPLGVAIVGGLLVSQILTLYTTPVVFLYIDRLRFGLGSLRDATRGGGGGARP
ncbi:MMPL family transporter [Methylosinus sporium]|uniref:MMPL family transporter n=1 Tax=Methylosinus sporium TaxID=428 RepID=A0A549SCN9_METSR|nr:efflux RND transporter permease subunit [Methylosinus sporium]TRL22047.1 MMPL family transporter [Methylosinus sporium]